MCNKDWFSTWNPYVRYFGLQSRFIVCRNFNWARTFCLSETLEDCTIMQASNSSISFITSPNWIKFVSSYLTHYKSKLDKVCVQLEASDVYFPWNKFHPHIHCGAKDMGKRSSIHHLWANWTHWNLVFAQFLTQTQFIDTNQFWHVLELGFANTLWTLSEIKSLQWLSFFSYFLINILKEYHWTWEFKGFKGLVD